MKWMPNVSQVAEILFFMKTSFYTFDKVTNSTFFYKDNVDVKMQPDDVRDELEIPTIPTTTRVSREFTFSGSNL